MQGTNRCGDGGEKSLLCDPGSELRLGGREKKKGNDNTRSKWDGEKKKEYLLTTYVTGFCSVAVLCTLPASWGTTPRNSQGRGSVVCTFSDSPGDLVIVVDYYVYGGCWCDCSFWLQVWGSPL